MLRHTLLYNLCYANPAYPPPYPTSPHIIAQPQVPRRRRPPQDDSAIRTQDLTLTLTPLPTSTRPQPYPNPDA